MPRPPKTIVPVDPEHQPQIRKFVSDGKKGSAIVVSGKANAKVTLKKRRRSTGEAKTKSQKRRPLLLSESIVTENIQRLYHQKWQLLHLIPYRLTLLCYKKLKIWKKEIQYLAAEQTKLKLQMTKIESKSLEYTVIMRGIQEEPKETEELCCDKIYRELANTISGSDPDERYTTAKTLAIRKCRRLGKFKRDRIRPICVEFVHKEDRTYVLENRSYLNDGVFVDKEYPPEIE